MKAGKRKAVQVNLTLDEELWEKACVVIDEMGFSKSGFVEFMLKQFMESDTKPFGKLIGDVFTTLVEQQKKPKKMARI
jgi:antitoxin component of RelBE/YafQ-DinJ toxin-antitoxin module